MIWPRIFRIIFSATQPLAILYRVFLLLKNVFSGCFCAGAPVGMWTWGHALAATLILSQPGVADYAHPILVSTPSFESHRRACWTRLKTGKSHHAIHSFLIHWMVVRSFLKYVYRWRCYCSTFISSFEPKKQ